MTAASIQGRAPAATARGAAADLVSGVVERQHSISDQIASGALSALRAPDRARAQRLALATLRSWDRAGFVLKPHLRKGPPARVAALLRVAVTEVLGEGAPAAAVVHDAVEAVRALGRPLDGFSGLANAVLRRATATDPSVWANLPPQELPGWLRGRLMSAYGKRAVLAMERAHAAGAPVDLTPRYGDAEGIAARLEGTVLPTGSVRLTTPSQISDLPGFAEGDWWVQDAAAAVAARALGVQPGERVLDLCAAPGGKTLQLAAVGGEVTALDISPSRMARVRENLDRCRLSATLVTGDALTWAPDRPFDAILLDAPCSATGTIRRHPDLPFLKNADALRPLMTLQAALIDRAAGWLVPGGRLAFATCSLLPDEGERQVTAALARNSDLSVDAEVWSAQAGLSADWINTGGVLRLRPDYWPDYGGMDGFAVALLRRRA
jgi:16S rRNA (cytosine967-C5)-methyltransferase